MKNNPVLLGYYPNNTGLYHNHTIYINWQKAFEKYHHKKKCKKIIDAR